MAKIYFICGFIGAGKTTHAQKLVQEHGAFRFTMDEWMIPLFGEYMEREVFDGHLATLENLFKRSALALLGIGTSVIFDPGYWSKRDREDIMQWAIDNNLDYEMHYIDASFEQCKQRAEKRNATRGENAYEMTPEMLEMFWAQFEVPTTEERQRMTVIT